jgi:endonuclease/exonuclease/phosphatase family metal-dependent hydrolase
MKKLKTRENNMKIATFNIQNLFHRDRSFLEKPFSKCYNDWLMEIDQLMGKFKKTNQENERLRELSFLLGMDHSFQLPYAVLRRKAGFLFLKGMNYSKELKAGDLTDWNGWIALQNYPLDPVAVENKARVIADVNPDVLILQEIEDRASLAEFNQEFLPRFHCKSFEQTFVVQGNDKRGQEIGILTRNGFEIRSVRSHSYDLNFLGQLVFNKDFIEYEIRTPKGNSLWILATHLQHQTEDKDISDDTREKQAERIAAVYNQLYSEGKKHIAVVGTLNAVSYCYSLSPLLLKTNLKDVTKHPTFNVDFDKGKDAGYHSLGAYRMGVNIKQKDYLLLSPELFAKVQSSGLNRKGIWPEKQPKWTTYPSMNQKNHAASEHPAIWGDFTF